MKKLKFCSICGKDAILNRHCIPNSAYDKKDLIDKAFESESPLPLAALVTVTVVMAWAAVWFISIII